MLLGFFDADILKICAPAGHVAVEQLIDATLNEHVAYQSKPLDLRNQRIYCVKVSRIRLTVTVANHDPWSGWSQQPA